MQNELCISDSGDYRNNTEQVHHFLVYFIMFCMLYGIE
jgi:hypothetical protein